MEGKNRACVLTALKTMEFRDVPVPEPAKGEILMKLEAVGMASVGVAGLSPEEPLVPQAQGKPWPVHVKGASCDQVRIRFDRFLCSFAGQPCGAVAVEQQGLAGIEPPVLARK